LLEVGWEKVTSRFALEIRFDLFEMKGMRYEVALEGLGTNQQTLSGSEMSFELRAPRRLLCCA
jgi:hypothetical protein